MAKIYDFPNANERDWREMELVLRESYKNMPDGIATLEECLPEIRAHWYEIFVSFSVQPSYQIPGPITEEQRNAIAVAVEGGVHLVVERLKTERIKFFGQLVVCEYKAAYFLRNGKSV